MPVLEYLALSSTFVSMMAVAALARDLRLPATLPEAPKTRARSNRALLMGSKWSEQQLLNAPRRTPTRHRVVSAPLHYEHGTSRRGWAEGPSKAMRLIDVTSIRAAGLAVSEGEIKVGFRGGEQAVEHGGRVLLVNVVEGIVKLWPAVPAR